MHAAQRALMFVEGDVALDDTGVESGLRELVGSEGAGKKAAFVGSGLQFDQDGPLQL